MQIALKKKVSIFLLSLNFPTIYLFHLLSSEILRDHNDQIICHLNKQHYFSA